MKQNVVIGFFGSERDKGWSPNRWSRWRPSLSLCVQPQFRVHQLHLMVTSEKHLSWTEPLINDIAEKSPGTQVIVHLVEMDDPFDFGEVVAKLYDFALTLTFDESKYDYFVHLATGTHEAKIALYRLAESRHFPARMVDTLKREHSDVEIWRGDLRIIDINLAVYDKLFSRFKVERLAVESLLKGGIVTRNEEYNQKIDRIEKITMRSDATLLLMGETGTGKSMLAQRIADRLARAKKVTGHFIPVNCANLDATRAESELFGHRRGSFTGAVSDHDGYLTAADGGILFLDEISHLSLEVQAKLLHALQYKTYVPVGGDPRKPVKSDFRLIVGTNRNLRREVEEGRFMEDLYARIDVWQITLPALAERWEDIEPNLEYELELAGERHQCLASFSPLAREKYLSFAIKAPWPGNFRDLAASVDRMVTLSEAGRILPADVDEEIERLKERWPRREARTGTGAGAGEKNADVAARPHYLLSEGLVDRVRPGLDIDVVDRAQLEVVLQAIRDTKSMAEAGRQLFAVSRAQRKSVNDTARVRAVLLAHGLSYAEIKQRLSAN